MYTGSTPGLTIFRSVGSNLNFATPISKMIYPDEKAYLLFNKICQILIKWKISHAIYSSEKVFLLPLVVWSQNYEIEFTSLFQANVKEWLNTWYVITSKRCKIIRISKKLFIIEVFSKCLHLFSCFIDIASFEFRNTQALKNNLRETWY